MTQDHSNTIGFIDKVVFVTQKNDFEWGHIVKQVQIHKKALVLYTKLCFLWTATAILGGLTVLAASRFVCVSVTTL